MLKRMIVVLPGVVILAVLSAFLSESRNKEIFVAKLGDPVEPQFPTATQPNCDLPKEKTPTYEIISTFDKLTYGDYLIQTRYRMAKLDVPPEYGPPPKPVRVSYAVVKRKGRMVAEFDGDIYFSLGNSLQGGLVSLLNNGNQQLIVSQDISRTGVQWVADFSQGFKFIFDGQKFYVGREGNDMTISDLDGDGLQEITVPITAFYGFQHWRLTTSETPLPDIIFKYDSEQREYLPANPHFKECLLRDIEAADKSSRALSEQPSLGRIMAIALDYIFVGEEQKGWKFFDEMCKLPDKAKIKADMQKELNKHPVYRYVYKMKTNR